MIAGALLAASLSFVAPGDRTTVAAGTLNVYLKSRGVPKGAHLHVVLDGGPALESTLEGPLKLEKLSPGPHTLRAVLVGKDHLTLQKKKGAFALSRFWVGPKPADAKQAKEAEQRAWPAPKKPILTLVNPTGNGHDKALLDVHVQGAPLSKRGHKVRIVVDKKEYPLLTDARPLPLKIKRGSHKITVDLLDRRATKVQPFNRTDREFETR